MEANDLKDLKELVEFLKASDVAEFELESETQTVKLKFTSAIVAAQAAAPAMDMSALMQMMAANKAAAPVAAAAAPAAAEAAPVVEAVKHHVVKSPIVGTFYEAPAPGSPPFVKIGDTVEVGQVLCIVEAMKLMNEIESDMAGEVVERIAATGQPVEYGQPLFSIKAK